MSDDISSLIKASEAIVDLIDRCVQAEEANLAILTGTETQQTSQPENSSVIFSNFQIHSNLRTMGTDIDHGAGDVDWSSVASTGTSWVYCKVSGGFSNANYDFKDPQFANYWAQLQKTQLARGAYCFFDLNADGIIQAQFFLQLLNAVGGLEAGDLPPCLDIEWTTTPSGVPFPTDTRWQDEALAWLNYVEQQTGRIPVIYTGLSMAQNHFDSRFSRYPLWVARYPTKDAITPTDNPYPSCEPSSVGPWKGWTIWQYSETGTISGIRSDQDLDLMTCSVEELVQTTTISSPTSPQQRSEKKQDTSSSQNNTSTYPNKNSTSTTAEQKTYMETVGGVQVYQTSPFHAVIYESGLNVDADGSPFAYHPEPDSDKGLDYLANAGNPGNWWGIATENGQSSGPPVIQGVNDPAPGYYVSTTSLEDSNYSSTDPRAYVNASEIPFIVLPLGHSNFGGAMGDLGAVVNLNNNKVAYVIAADAGPQNQLGEGSVALAEALGINSSPKNGGISNGIAYCFFPGSGNGRPQTVDNINNAGAKLFAEFGGVTRLKRLLTDK